MTRQITVSILTDLLYDFLPDLSRSDLTVPADRGPLSRIVVNFTDNGPAALGMISGAGLAAEYDESR